MYPAYLDDELAIVDLAAVLSHIMSCDPCAARDVALRRGLLIARSLPPLRPTAGFAARLSARLAKERSETVFMDSASIFQPWPRRPSPLSKQP